MIMYNLYSYLNFKIVYCLTKTCARFASWVANIFPYCVCLICVRCVQCTGIFELSKASGMNENTKKIFLQDRFYTQPRAFVTQKCLRSRYFTQNILHLVQSYSPIFNTCIQFLFICIRRFSVLLFQYTTFMQVYFLNRTVCFVIIWHTK